MDAPQIVTPEMISPDDIAPDDIILEEVVDGYVRVFRRADGATAEYGPAGDRLTEWEFLAPMIAKTVTPEIIPTLALTDRIHAAYHRYNGKAAPCWRCDRFPPKDMTPWVSGRAA